MCTVTLIPLAGATTDATGFRMVCNRDEARTRAAAFPPAIFQLGSLSAIYPIDPRSHGTWIAVNEAGIALTLLNIHPPGWREMLADPSRGSRGQIIPSLLDADSLDDVQARIARLAPTAYPAFRLLAIDESDLIDAVSDGRRVAIERRARGSNAWLFSSSGLGDELVEPPRRRLFESMFTSGDLADAQAAYHRSSWSTHPELSVCMRRPDACTVSQTIVDVSPEYVRLRYLGCPPDHSGEWVDHKLERLLIRA